MSDLWKEKGLYEEVQDLSDMLQEVSQRRPNSRSNKVFLVNVDDRRYLSSEFTVRLSSRGDSGSPRESSETDQVFDLIVRSSELDIPKESREARARRNNTPNSELTSCRALGARQGHQRWPLPRTTAKLFTELKRSRAERTPN